MSEPILQPQKDNEQTWNVLCHLSALAGLIFPIRIYHSPFDYLVN